MRSADARSTDASSADVSPASSAAAGGSFDDPDRTARARIRDAAIARFAADGVAGTSLKSIAADAGVSPPLVIHHFGSKDGLRAACDQYVAALIRSRKREAMAAGAGLDPFQAIRDSQQGPPLMRYLAATLVDGSRHVDELIDEMAEDAIGYMDEGVASGLLKPSDHPRERAIVLTLWNLGALVLHEHAKRLLGVDLMVEPDDLDGWRAWLMPTMEIMTKGILDDNFYETWRGAMGADPNRATEPTRPTKPPTKPRKEPS